MTTFKGRRFDAWGEGTEFPETAPGETLRPVMTSFSGGVVSFVFDATITITGSQPYTEDYDTLIQIHETEEREFDTEITVTSTRENYFFQTEQDLQNTPELDFDAFINVLAGDLPFASDNDTRILISNTNIEQDFDTIQRISASVAYAFDVKINVIEENPLAGARRTGGNWEHF